MVMGRGRTVVFLFLKRGASVFNGRALHFSFCLITKAYFERIAMNTHIPCVVLQQRASNDIKKSNLTFN